MVKSADIASIVVALADSRRERNRVDIASQLSTGTKKWTGNDTRRTGAPFLLLDMGGVGLVHGIDYIDLSAGCV